MTDNDSILRLALIRRIMDFDTRQLLKAIRAIERMRPDNPPVVLPAGLPDLIPITDAARMLRMSRGQLARLAAKRWLESGDAVKIKTSGQMTWHLRRQLIESRASSLLRCAPCAQATTENTPRAAESAQIDS